MIELGVNVDHVATVRQARRTYEPDPVWAAVEAHLGLRFILMEAHLGLRVTLMLKKAITLIAVFIRLL